MPKKGVNSTLWGDHIENFAQGGGWWGGGGVGVGVVGGLGGGQGRSGMPKRRGSNNRHGEDGKGSNILSQ